VWKGWFREAGLDVELVRIGGQAALPALLNGEVSYLFGWSAASGGIVQGAPIKLLAILLDRPPHVIVAQADVRSVADLRGRRVASSRAGGTDDLIIQHALQGVGLRLDDVEMARLGETSTRYSALAAGQVDAAALIQPFTAEAEKLGMHVLVGGGDVLRLPVGIVGTSQAHLAAEPGEVRAFLGVVARDLAYLRDPSNTAEIVQLATAQLDLDPALAAVMVDEALATVALDGQAPDAVLDAAIDVARLQAGKPEPLSLAGVVDFSLLRAARQSLGQP
jgi:NitT/TauT family transport system substrate-binding protein